MTGRRRGPDRPDRATTSPVTLTAPAPRDNFRGLHQRGSVRGVRGESPERGILSGGSVRRSFQGLCYRFSMLSSVAPADQRTTQKTPGPAGSSGSEGLFSSRRSTHNRNILVECEKMPDREERQPRTNPPHHLPPLPPDPFLKIAVDQGAREKWRPLGEDQSFLSGANGSFAMLTLAESICFSVTPSSPPALPRVTGTVHSP